MNNVERLREALASWRNAGANDLEQACDLALAADDLLAELDAQKAEPVDWQMRSTHYNVDWHRISKESYDELFPRDNLQWELRALYAAPQPQPQPQAIDRDGLLGAIARGWCHPRNTGKTIDPELAESIAREVAEFIGTQPQASVSREDIDAVDADIRMWSREGYPEHQAWMRLHPALLTMVEASARLATQQPQAVCSGCNGRGEIGGPLSDGSFQTDPCPWCTAAPQPQAVPEGWPAGRAARAMWEAATQPQPQASAEDVALVDAWAIQGADPEGYEAWQRIRASLGVGK